MKSPSSVKRAAAERMAPKRRKSATKLKSAPSQKKPEPVEIGLPASLAKSCVILRKFPVRTTRQESEVRRLLNSTIANIRRLDQMPVARLRAYACGMTEFPMLVSLRTNQTLLRDRLGPTGLNLARVRGPGHTFNARWTNDRFAIVAEKMLFEISGGPPPSITLKLWKEFLYPILRRQIKSYLAKEPNEYQTLVSLITVTNDKRSKSRLKDKVIERLLNLSQALVGLKALRYFA
jgi:hypothetical protein